MHDFIYVAKKESTPIKLNLIGLISEVQNLVRSEFTFKYQFVGSASKQRNMITQDRKSNIGFDFDVNIEVNDDSENYSAKQIRFLIRDAINRVAYKYGYNCCEDSTSVLTIKVIYPFASRVTHSCDFAIVYNCDDDKQQYVRFNKNADNSYTWEYRGRGYETLQQKEEWLKRNNYWGQLRKYYIHKKNINDNKYKHSRTIFFESVHEMCVKKGYFK